MSFFDPQNPGIDLNPLTPAERDFVVNLAGQSYSEGDILYHNGTQFVPLSIGAEDDVLTVSASGVPEWVTSTSGATQLGELSDVNTSTPTNRNVLVADGTDWESRALAATDVQSGTFVDARISESSVTQHEGAISITESQITDLDHTDANAIHDNVSGEIAALTEKGSPDNTDVVIIEDSAASNAKKKVQVGNLTGATYSNEEAQDAFGAMLTGTQTLITVTYDDVNNEVDFVVDNDLSNYDNGTSGFITATLTDEEVQDIVGGMVSGNTESLITVAYQDTDGTIDFTVEPNLSNYTNDAGFITATLTNEEVQDIVGGMFSGNTETLVTVTYQDVDGTIDVVVDNDLSNYDNSTSHFIDTAGTGLSRSGSTLNVTGLTTSELAAATLVTESEGIGSNDNDTTLPTSAAVIDYVANNAGGVDYQTFSSDGTWYKPSGAQIVIVKVWGGGGSGGRYGNNMEGGGGGGGGAYSEAIIPASELGASVSVTVGAGGASPGTGSGSVSGSDGGSSSFGTFVTADGGGKGGAGNGGSGGDSESLNFDSLAGGAGGAKQAGTSESGGDGYYGGGGGGGGSDYQDNAGNGGDSIFGGAGGAGYDDTGTVAVGGTSRLGGDGGDEAQDGVVPGGGGGGGQQSNAPGSGADGLVIVITL